MSAKGSEGRWIYTYIQEAERFEHLLNHVFNAILIIFFLKPMIESFSEPNATMLRTSGTRNWAKLHSELKYFGRSDDANDSLFIHYLFIFLYGIGLTFFWGNDEFSKKKVYFNYCERKIFFHIYFNVNAWDTNEAKGRKLLYSRPKPYFVSTVMEKKNWTKVFVQNSIMEGVFTLIFWDIKLRDIHIFWQKKIIIRKKKKTKKR